MYNFSGPLLGSAFQQLDVKFSLGVIEGVDSDVSVLGFEETDNVVGAVEQLFLAHNFTSRDDGVLRTKDVSKHVVEVDYPVATVSHDLDVDSDRVEISSAVLYMGLLLICRMTFRSPFSIRSRADS